MNEQTKKITAIAMLSAIAFIAVAIIQIPVVMFLKYEPKDVIIILGGFLFGPLSAFIISVISSLAEMVTFSDTGIIGCIMNIISSASFACVAALIYKKKKNTKGAIIGMIVGCIFMVILMLLWNYIITPIYMGYPRQAVAEMLIPVFLPYNLIKGGLNISITLLIYKPIFSTLRKVNLLPETGLDTESKINKGLLVSSVVLLSTVVLILLLFSGVISI